jgi:hypothetical protein
MAESVIRGQAPEAVAGYTFGDIPFERGDVPVEIELSDDRRALTMRFSEGASVEAGAGSPAIGMRSFSQVLPVMGEGRAEIEFTMQAGIVLGPGTTATMLLSVNGQSDVTDFTTDPDQTAVQKLTFVAEQPTECRLLALLVVGRDSQSDRGDAILNFVTLDAEILPRPSGPAGS